MFIGVFENLKKNYEMVTFLPFFRFSCPPRGENRNKLLCDDYINTLGFICQVQIEKFSIICGMEGWKSGRMEEWKGEG